MRLKPFVCRHRPLVKRAFFAALLLVGAATLALVAYLESLNVWRALFTAMTKWEMMAFIVMANAIVFVLLLLSLKITNWLHDDDPEG
ncbi:MAG TPA: hypothetical protein VEB64_14430 [Azospirillaceae bacterium]|nr:hypothetical protein [Azospirillaceae bacterium]